MSIPSLKKVNLSQDITELTGQLDQISFDDVPLAINISHLKEQIQAIKIIETYIKDNRIKLTPYPISIITTEDYKSSELLILNDTKEFPRFFSQKIKPLNLKENALLKKIYLLQEKIKGTDIKASKDVFQNYAATSKKINMLNRQSTFIDIILKGRLK
jgi:hypothetical protein